MHVREAILTRRTVHSYLPEPIPPGALDRALEAAHHAPCHQQTWPWRFVVVGPQTRERLVPMYQAVKLGDRVPSPELAAALRGKIVDAAEMVVVCQVRSDDPFRAREDYAAVACAVQNLCLSLTGEGVSTKWTTGGITRHELTYRLMGVDPEHAEIVGFVWVGVARKIPSVSRPPVADFVRRLP